MINTGTNDYLEYLYFLQSSLDVSKWVNSLLRKKEKLI